MEFSSPLAHLLEALPLPVMLRSQEGVVIENRLWQEYQPAASPQWQLHHQHLSGVLAGIEFIMAENVTQQSALQQQVLTQQTHLAQLQRIKDEFLSCVTHELRSPLTVVLGMTDLLERQLIHQLTDRQRHYLKSIHRSGNRLVSMIDDMVDVTKAETGQLPLEISKVDVRSICEQVIFRIQQQDFPLTPSITLEIEHGLDSIAGDQNRLQQMLVHLLSNACRFTPEHAVPQVGIRVQHWEPWIAFTVWDQGIGIPDEYQSLIFQKFQQVESPRTRRFDGTGLGLVLTRQLARLHGGDVTFVSRLGVGSEFTLLLPPTPRLPLPSRQLVLIVDALPENIKSMAEVVRSADFYPIVARSGIEALEKARQLRPCCIFLSTELPLLSGKDVLTLLQQDQALCQTRLISFASHPPDRADILSHLPRQPAGPKILCIGCEAWEALNELPFRRIAVEDIDQAEHLAPIWKPEILMIGQEGFLHQIRKNGHLVQVPIVVEKLENDLFPHLNLFSCADRGLMGTIKDLLRSIPHHRPY